MRTLLAAPGVCLLFLALSAGQTPSDSRSFLEGELIFQPEHWHNHGSCIVEGPNGDLIVCWYNGSGERTADNVKIEGARKKKGEKTWSKRFLMADTPGFPDTNPCMVIDAKDRLWLIWQAIIANEWHTALCKYKISSSYDRDGPPKWEFSDTILLKPGPEFAATVTKFVESAENVGGRSSAYLAGLKKRAEDKYFSRMGWMTRAHPFILDGKRLIVPLYSDGYSFSLMAISDDWGATWTSSAPLVGGGAVQPSIAKKKDGTLVTYMRDNGPPPKRLLMSESKDQGMTWSPVKDSVVPNPGAGAEVAGLKNGNWVLINNDTEKGRHSLAVWLSDDEGKTWKWKRHLEHNEPGPDATHAGYPSIVQAKDGTLHASYTYTLNGKNAKTDAQGRPLRECIKHAHFNEAWIKAGEGNR